MADAESAVQVPETPNSSDRSADVRALLVIFCTLVLGAVHFISGWTFDL